MAVAGIDVGATRVKLGVVGRRGRLVARGTIETQGGAELYDRIAAWLAQRPRVRAVGLGFCGMVDADRGVVMSTTDTLPGFSGVPVAAELRRRIGVRVRMDNDANCAALGEARWGAGAGMRSMVMLTLGTGVGGGIVLDGALVRGAGHMAAKLGHLKVRPSGRRCPCGDRGCLEAYASAWAFRRAYGADAREMLAQAQRGEPRAQKLADDAAVALGTAFADIAHTMNPERIVVGGGIAAGFHLMRPRALAVYRARALPGAFATTRVVKAKLGAWSGVIGAAELAASQP